MSEPKNRRRRVIVALCVLVAALAAVYAFVGDRTVWGEWISVAPPAVWGVLLLPSVVRLRSGLLFAVVASFVVLLTEWPRIAPKRAPPRETVRVVSWNIGAGNRGWAEAVSPRSRTRSSASGWPWTRILAGVWDCRRVA